MILGKIDPVIKLAQQVDNFTYTEVTGSYITALARRYALGEQKVTFEVAFGNLENGNFSNLTQNSVELSGQDIENWGTDDSVILRKLAELSGTQVTEIVTGSFRSNRF